MNLAEYVGKTTRRGSCGCGRCFDAPDEPSKPDGHTVSVEFFDVSQQGANKDTFLDLVRSEFPHWLDGKEHSYLETGADIGDQGLAMQAMALGQLLGAWELMTPSKMLGTDVDKDIAMQMAGSGYVTIRYTS